MQTMPFVRILCSDLGHANYLRPNHTKQVSAIKYKLPASFVQNNNRVIHHAETA